MDLSTKQKLIEACTSYVDKKLQTLQAAIDDLQAALKLETKCSMGDKYETGRAMLHLEFEKLAGQYEEFQKLKKTLGRIPSKKASENVIFGSAVKTSVANYFIAIPAGEITAENEKFYAVGANAPISQSLLGKTEGESFSFNGRNISITEVF